MPDEPIDPVTGLPIPEEASAPDLPPQEVDSAAGEPEVPLTEAQVKQTELELIKKDDEAAETDGQMYDLHLDLTEEQRENLAQKICAEIGDILNDPERQQKMKDFEEWEDAYNGVVNEDASQMPGGANIHLYLEARHVDRARPRVKQSLKVRPFWIVDPTEPADEKSVTKVENLLDYTAIRDMDLPKLQHFALNDDFKKGTAILKLTYLKKRETIWDIEEYRNTQEFDYKYGADGKKKYPAFYAMLKKLKPGDEPIKFIATRPTITYDAPLGERVPPEDFVSSIGERDLNKVRLAGHRFELIWDEILERKDRKDSTRFDDIEKLSRRFDNDGNAITSPDYDKEPTEFYEVIYRYRDAKGKQRKGVFTVGYEARAIVQASRFPYLHNHCYYIPFYIDPNENSFWGNGLTQKVRHISRALKKVIDTLINAGIASNIPTFVGNTVGGMRGHRGRWYPGKIYSSPSPNTDVHQLTIKGADPLLFKLASYLEEISDMATGIMRGMSGETLATDPNAPGNKTIALLQEANINIGEYTENFQASNAELGYQVGQLIWQHMGPRKTFKILGEGDRTKPEVITRAEAEAFKANYRPHGTTEISNKALQNQIAMLVRNTLLSSPIIQKAIQNGNMEPVRVIEEVFLRTVGGEWDKRIHKLLPTPEEVKEEAQAMNTESLRQIYREEEEKAEAELAGQGGNGGRKLNSQSISALTNPMPAATVSLKKLVRPWPKLMVPPTQ